MKTEDYVIKIGFRGQYREIPVRITTGGLGRKIAVELEGTEICFDRDDHDGLRAINHQEEFDPELLYLIGKGIQEQCT